MEADEQRTRLQEIDHELDLLRQELGAHEQQSDQPGDAGDAGAELHAREELTTRIEDLEAERHTLTDADPSTPS